MPRPTPKSVFAKSGSARSALSVLVRKACKPEEGSEAADDGALSRPALSSDIWEWLYTERNDNKNNKSKTSLEDHASSTTPCLLDAKH